MCIRDSVRAVLRAGHRGAAGAGGTHRRRHRPGRAGDVYKRQAVQSYCEDAGFSVVRDFVGHGTGKELHEDPEVPNYGHQGRGPRLVPGMTIAIEPMICQGDYKIKQLSDGWTVKTKDGGLAAHFEHSIACLLYTSRCV